MAIEKAFTIAVPNEPYVNDFSDGITQAATYNGDRYIKFQYNATTGFIAGVIGNGDFNNMTIGKAGRTRWLGIKPTVRGVVMNPCDHAHGGGEGRSPIGRKRPITPWGKPALGVKTRKNNKSSDNYIIRRRK